MADTKLSDLTAVSAIADADLVYIVTAALLSRGITFLDLEDSIRVATGALDGFLAFADKTKLDNLGTMSVEDINSVPAMTYLGTQSFADQILDRPFFKDYAENIAVDATATGAQILDYSDGNIIEWTLTGNITSIVINNFPAAGRHGKLTLYIKQGAGPFTIAWPAAVSWAAGGPPSLSPVSGDVDVIVLTTLNAGGKLYGFHSGTDM